MLEEVAKKERRRKKSQNRYAKIGLFCKQTADIGCWMMFVYNYYNYDTKKCFALFIERAIMFPYK